MDISQFNVIWWVSEAGSAYIYLMASTHLDGGEEEIDTIIKFLFVIVQAMLMMWASDVS